ncbi:hypothetical protein BK128_09800 [Viridibacillus sp. FSL H7-0596]|uniref:hypothetical protein n=1 Tax=Viridibacillus sp. FSL H7-0596 TaxID=1928923 RepID=UPI00096DF9DE|nr:hypothetical protein [Viridibacillus sp. FSL H7-0596]OMC86948.1 hypothetical protein BK128_09800 [Viridibacillus sp. FSL H7-0596]
MKTLEIDLTNKLIAVLEHARNDMLQGCRLGLAKAEIKRDENGINYWSSEIEDMHHLNYNALHNIFIEAHYRKINSP